MADRSPGDAGDGKDYQALSQDSTEITADLPAEASADPRPQLGYSSSAGGGVNTTSTMSMGSFGPLAYKAPAAMREEWSELTKAQKKRMREKARKQAQMGE